MKSTALARVTLIATAIALVSCGNDAWQGRTQHDTYQPGPPSEPDVPSTISRACLRWPPPELHDPQHIDIAPSDTFVYIRLDVSRDYVISLPEVPLRAGLSLDGGRNVVVIGGEIGIPWQGAAPSIPSRRALLVRNAVGTVHLEGLLLGGDDLSEGIQISAPHGTVQVQNVHVTEIRARDQVGFSDNHPDLIQTYGNVGQLRIDGFSGTTDYQGLFFKPDFNGPVHGDVFLSRVNVTGSPTARQLIWLSPTSETAPNIDMDDVWIYPPEHRRHPADAVWPNRYADTPYRSQSGTTANGTPYAHWPGLLGVDGVVHIGRPPEGDFVPAEAVGLGYRSPGYGGGDCSN